MCFPDGNCDRDKLSENSVFVGAQEGKKDILFYIRCDP